MGPSLSYFFTAIRLYACAFYFLLHSGARFGPASTTVAALSRSEAVLATKPEALVAVARSRTSAPEALRWYEAAAQRRHVPSMVDAASGFFRLKKFDKAIAFYKKAAAKGNDIALYELAVLFSEGSVVFRNSTKAAFLFAESAKQGRHVSAMYNLGRLLEEEEEHQEGRHTDMKTLTPESGKKRKNDAGKVFSVVRESLLQHTSTASSSPAPDEHQRRTGRLLPWSESDATNRTAWAGPVLSLALQFYQEACSSGAAYRDDPSCKGGDGPGGLDVNSGTGDTTSTTEKNRCAFTSSSHLGKVDDGEREPSTLLNSVFPSRPRPVEAVLEKDTANHTHHTRNNFTHLNNSTSTAEDVESSWLWDSLFGTKEDAMIDGSRRGETARANIAHKQDDPSMPGTVVAPGPEVDDHDFDAGWDDTEDVDVEATSNDSSITRGLTSGDRLLVSELFANKTDPEYNALLRQYAALMRTNTEINRKVPGTTASSHEHPRFIVPPEHPNWPRIRSTAIQTAAKACYSAARIHLAELDRRSDLAGYSGTGRDDVNEGKTRGVSVVDPEVAMQANEELQPGKVANLFVKAFELDDTHGKAAYNAAILFFAEEDRHLAYKYARKAAANHIPEAMHMLATMYGQDNKPKNAEKWRKKLKQHKKLDETRKKRKTDL
ncbi:unnamed protein product [Amoebophrya sp. A120]|nr:unnamed protein product [Amoebophrya sp. A120]|eukprot:GSA120T00022998001.1